MMDTGSHSACSSLAGCTERERKRARGGGAAGSHQGTVLVELPFGCMLFASIVFVRGDCSVGRNFISSLMRVFIKYRFNKQESMSQMTPREGGAMPRVGETPGLAWSLGGVL